MYQGHRAAYYIKAFLQGNDKPLSYRTPYRTRRVEICNDPAWELNPRVEQQFHGLGEDPGRVPRNRIDLQPRRGAFRSGALFSLRCRNRFRGLHRQQPRIHFRDVAHHAEPGRDRNQYPATAG